VKASLTKVVFKCVVGALCSIVLFGCATVGSKQITRDEIVSQIKEGESTQAEVRELLGEPSSVSFTDTEEEIWTYCYSRSVTRATTFIPVVNIFAGGSDVQNYTLTIRFTKEGVVKKVGRGKTTGGVGSVFD
jgi:outer membrane protein assembly factor BamE (lipoprotein component of BamABCDE complex)